MRRPSRKIAARGVKPTLRMAMSLKSTKNWLNASGVGLCGSSLMSRRSNATNNFKSEAPVESRGK